MRQLSTKLRQLLFLTLLIAGCGSSDTDLVFQPQTSAPTDTRARLQVTVETTPLRGQEALYQLSSNVRRLVTYVFTPTGQVLATQDTAVNPAQASVSQDFPGLPAGRAVVRVLAYDASGVLVGYRDTAVLLSAGTTTSIGIDSLIAGSPDDGPGFEPPAPTPQPQPTPEPQPQPPLPPAPTPAPRVVSLTIETSPALVPDSSGRTTLALEVSRTAQLTVRATYDSGLSTDVTSQALFTSSNSAAVAVTEQGRVQAIAPATAVVTASLDGVQARLDVVSFQAPPLPPSPPSPPVLTPSITGLSPAIGSLAGGASVTITGANLTGATSVTFGTTPATSFTVDSSTQISAVAPAGSVGGVRVSVITPQGTTADTVADDYTYAEAPVLTSLSDYEGPLAGGNSVILTGSGFTGATRVTVGNQTATFTVDSDVQITVTIPSSPIEDVVSINVTTPAGTSASAKGAYYQYVIPPLTLTSVTPSRVVILGGTVVIVTGTGFVDVTSVTIGGIPASAYRRISDTELSVTVPRNAAGLADLVVTRSSGSATLPNALTYVPIPTISRFTPSVGTSAGGQIVTITGSGFTGATGVDFGASPGTSFMVVSDSEIRVTTPAGSVGRPLVVLHTAVGSLGAFGVYDYE